MRYGDWLDTVRREVSVNRGYPKSILLVVSLRVAQLARSRDGVAAKLVYLVVGGFYKLLSEWVLGVEIPASTRSVQVCGSVMASASW